MTVNYLLMDNRIRMEKQHKPIDQVTELILDNCQASHITGLSDDFINLKTLSIINVGLTTLKGFPKLPNLERLALCDNRLSEGLNQLLGCQKLQELNLSGNSFRDIGSLEPLRGLKNLTSLDIYNCDITRFGDYKQKVFDMLPNLQLLDGFDREYKEPETNIVTEAIVEDANKELSPNSCDQESAVKLMTDVEQQIEKEPVRVNIISVVDESTNNEATCPIKEDIQVIEESVADGDAEMSCDDIKDNHKVVEVIGAGQPEEASEPEKAEIQDSQVVQDALNSHESRDHSRMQTDTGVDNLAPISEADQYTCMNSMVEHDETTSILVTDHNTSVVAEQNTTFDLGPDQNTTIDLAPEQDASNDAALEENTTNDSEPGQKVTSDSTPDQDTSGEQASADQEFSSGDNSGGQDSIIEISVEHDSSYGEEADDSGETLHSNDEDEEEDLSELSEEADFEVDNGLEEGECIDDQEEEEEGEEEDNDEEEEEANKFDNNNLTIEVSTEDEEGGDVEVQEKNEQEQEEQEQEQEEEQKLKQNQEQEQQ